jgi:hypothetical protein
VRTYADLQRQANAVGATIVRSWVVNGVLMAELDVPDIQEGVPMNTAMLLEGLTSTDESTHALPHGFVAWASSHGPAALQKYIQDHVRYTDEDTETFMSPAMTLASGIGDCDDSERLFVAVARACGWQARLVYYMQDNQPAHVTAQVWDASQGGWTWCETTIAARYGEEPFAALRRLGLPRSDINGAPFVVENGKAVPLRGLCTMKAITDWPSYLGETFAQTLVDWSAQIGANPLDILKLLISESGLQPGAWNPNGFASGQGAVGINQLAPVNYGYISNAGYTVAQYRQLTAEQQLPVVFAYFQQVMQNAGLSSISGRDLYWLNFLPATFVAGAPDSHVIVSQSSGYYTNNTGLDHGSKGYITAGDLQTQLDASENNPLWPLVSASVLEDSPLSGASAVTTGIVLLLAFAAGAYFGDHGVTLRHALKLA